MSSNYLDDDAAVQLQVDVERIISQWTGMQAPLAAPMAKLIVEGMRETYGGQRIYIPAIRRRHDLLAARGQRDMQIAASFSVRLRGNNCTRAQIVQQVMREFDVSRRTVYRAIAGERQVVPATA